MANILALTNQKGGVGKTTSAYNIGAALHEQGQKVLLVDFDPQGNLSAYVGFQPDDLPTIEQLIEYAQLNGLAAYHESEPSPEQTAAQDIIHKAIRTNAEDIDYIPASIILASAEMSLINAMCREYLLKTVLSYVAHQYDYILIDCPPSLGILSINALTASTGILIPVQAQNFALDGIILLLDSYKRIKAGANPSLEIEGFLLTMTNNTTMSNNVSQVLREQFGDLVFKTTISQSTQAPNSTVEPHSLLKGKSKLGDQYRAIATEILQKGEQAHA